MKSAKTAIHALRSKMFTCCYGKRLSPEEKDRIYDEICKELNWLEDSLRRKERRKDNAITDIVVTGFGQ